MATPRSVQKEKFTRVWNEDLYYNPNCWHCGKAWKKATYRERAWSSQRKKWQWPKDDATWWTRQAKNKEGMADQALTKAWGTLSMEAKKAIEEAGWKPRTMEPGPIWPPGLPGSGSQTESMTQKEYHAAIETVWQGAEPAVQRLLRAAGIPPPGDYKPEDETPKQELSRHVGTYRRTTNKLRSLIEKKVRLQDKTEKIKSEFEQAMKQLAQVSQAIQATELEVAEAQKKVQACVKDEEDSPYKDVASYLKRKGSSCPRSKRRRSKRGWRSRSWRQIGRESWDKESRACQSN